MERGKSVNPRAILVINSGSSTLKFALVEPGDGEVLEQGLVDHVGDHSQALAQVFAKVAPERVAAIGHRVVHGGEHFAESVQLDRHVLETLRECTPLAPLHNPANLAGIEAALERFPGLPQVLVFDTAFHQTLPKKAFLYALPHELYERHRVRRYGFHGTSHGYVASVAAERLGKPLEELQLITAHLGNGCSCCAVRHGRSVDTTMGLTPLEGLVMGTRSGDVDPGLHAFLVEHTGRSLTQVTELLNRESGLLGLSGQSADMRTLLLARAAGDGRAALAIDVFCYRLAKSILAQCAALERVDALIFTGGIGEHAASVRADTLAQLRMLGAIVDPDLNLEHGVTTLGRISHKDSRLMALVVPTNEELVIARETARVALRDATP
ncbi:MAG TPA: acetate kinase [Polyangiaceae bacterium]|nr:acetate kinase [Polyangiaceae bacterium]